MIVSLEKRATELVELMDVPDCDPVLLANTYRNFDRVNLLVSDWHGLYRRYIRPTIRSAGGRATLLDIGCGGGDVLRHIVSWAERDGFTVHATGADPDERAIDYARKAATKSGIRYITTASTKLADTGTQFDIVLSNHVLHHLTDREVTQLCQDSERLAKRLVLHADICRSPIAYATFPLLGMLFPNTFISVDGLLSIRRSFTIAELARLAPVGWQVRAGFPFRCVLSWTP